MPSIEPLPGVDSRLSKRRCESRFAEKFFSEKFLVGWTICRFHGARGGGAERQAEMAITGTVPEPRPPSSFGASSNR
jgi:hypothetical protein